MTGLIGRVVIEPIVAEIAGPEVLRSDRDLVRTIELWWDWERKGHRPARAGIESGDVITVSARPHRSHQDLEVRVSREIRRLDSHTGVAHDAGDPDCWDRSIIIVIGVIIDPPPARATIVASSDIIEPLVVVEYFAVLLLLDQADYELVCPLEFSRDIQDRFKAAASVGVDIRQIFPFVSTAGPATYPGFEQDVARKIIGADGRARIMADACD